MKSEILTGIETGAIIQKEDISLMIPSSLCQVLESYSCDISVWEHVLFVIHNEKYPEKIVLSRNVDEDIVSGKLLLIETTNKFEIRPYSMRTSV